MDPPRCLYLLAHSAQEDHDLVVRDFVTPLVREIRGRPELVSLFFVRMSEPTWQVRFRVVGDPEWIGGPYREAAEQAAAPLREAGVITELEATHYEREVERYGGEEGMALAEELYTHDTWACLEWLALERRGELGRQRREIALLLGELYADHLGLAGEPRRRFYQNGYRWTRDMGTWDDADFARLDQRYEALRPGLAELLAGATRRDPAALWGGEASARVAAELTAAAGPVLERIRQAHAAGRLRQDLAYLGWSYTHLASNRLGLPPAPEAILRYLMQRFHDDDRPLPAPSGGPRGDG
jgi:thiopeptide-type bacteriocin biosynthesis protein